MIRLLEEDFLSVFRDEDTLSRIEHAASLQVVVFLGGRSGSVDVVDARHLVAKANDYTTLCLPFNVNLPENLLAAIAVNLAL